MKHYHTNNEIIGKRFGKLTVKSLAYKKEKTTYWLCVCDCGKEKTVRRINLTQLGTKSCGCLRQEVKMIIAAKQKGKPRYSKDQGDGGCQQLFLRYKKHRNAVDFQLTIEEFRSITTKKCYYCGIEPLQETRYYNKRVTKETEEKSKFIYNGIDRIDNSQGYVLTNCVPCCKICNKAKSNMRVDDFVEWVLRAADFLKSNNNLRQ
jgi:5-methylcytosine-specific restriction endonuclease McrA